MRKSSYTALPMLVSAYLRHATRAVERGTQDPDSWAFDEVNARVGRHGQAEDAWNVVSALVAEAQVEQLGYIGAGPVEDMIKNHGTVLFEWIEGAARRDERFQYALTRIWLNEGDLPPSILLRLQNASGIRIAVLNAPDDAPAT
jgi:hypothetical protein